MKLPRSVPSMLDLIGATLIVVAVGMMYLPAGLAVAGVTFILAGYAVRSRGR